MIRLIQGCSDLSIVRSTLIGNEEWKNLGEDSAWQRSPPDARPDPRAQV